MARQVSDLVVFDFLTSNPDRYSGGNMKMSPDGSELFYMDNTMSFFLDPQGKEKIRDVLFRTQRFSRSLFDALEPHHRRHAASRRWAPRRGQRTRS